MKQIQKELDKFLAELEGNERLLLQIIGEHLLEKGEIPETPEIIRKFPTGAFKDEIAAENWIRRTKTKLTGLLKIRIDRLG